MLCFINQGVLDHTDPCFVAVSNVTMLPARAVASALEPTHRIDVPFEFLPSHSRVCRIDMRVVELCDVLRNFAEVPPQAIDGKGFAVECHAGPG